jgi:fatty acid desaturase
VTQILSDKTMMAGIDKAQRQTLFRKSNSKGLRHLIGHLAALGLFGTYIFLKLPAWPLALVPYGVILVFLFMPLHETIHLTAFRSVWLNKIVAFVCGLVVVIPPVWFRYFHFDHHRFTSDPKRDPELTVPKPFTRLGYLWHLTGLAVWKSLVTTLARNALGKCQDAFVPAKAQKYVKQEALVFILIYMTLIAGSLYLQRAELFWLWLLPAFIGQSFLRAYLLAEHMLCEQSPDMLKNSRTLQSNPVTRFFAWNMPFHAEHHLMPAVPFHRLPDLHVLTKPHLKTFDQGYADVHRQIWQSLKQEGGASQAPPH